MPVCLIGLGGNLSNPASAFGLVLERLNRQQGVQVLSRSRWHQTTPIGGPENQDDYLNGALLVETSLSPPELLRTTQRLENELGRQRRQRWGPRTIDLDLLIYDQVRMRTPELEIPHPRMAFRRFVLEPASEVAPDLVHPSTGWTVERLLENLDRPGDYIALTGALSTGKTTVARCVAEQLDGVFVAEEVDCELLQRYYNDPRAADRDTEFKILATRARLLNRSKWEAESRWIVSDFWIEQSLALGRIRLDQPTLERLSLIYSEMYRGLLSPKLLVVLEANDPDVLLERVRQGGRSFESSLDCSWLHSWNREILAQAENSDLGPVLRLDWESAEDASKEVIAAARAMQ